VQPPIDRSASWPYDAGEPGPYSYARAGHPTGVACEAALGVLDSGSALLFPSGMAAVTTMLFTLLQPGGTVALAEGAYYGHGALLDHFAGWGIATLEFDQTGPPPAGADLILVEAPSNPMLTMPDLEAAAAHPAPVACDATVASPLRLRPLEQGCDLVLHSATKVLSGHDDVLAGVIVARDADLHERLHTTRHRTGIVASADTAWLVHRGLETLEVRLERQEQTATELADRLRSHPAVEVVRYPGFSFLASFDVADGEAARRVETSVHTIVNGTSLGGTTTKLEGRHRWEGDRCPPGLLRLSVGLEDVEELWADLEQALNRAEGDTL
jgi:cystathionine gamma-synthase